MAENWQEIVPFYVAGVLSPEEKAAFEAFLRTSPEGRKAVEEWREIARGVWQDVAARSRHLPPLSAGFRAQLRPPTSANGHRPPAELEMTVPGYAAPRANYAQAMTNPYPPQKRRMRLVPAVSVAVSVAAMMILVFGILLASLLSDDQPDEQGAPPDVLTATAAAITPSAQPTSTTVSLMMETAEATQEAIENRPTSAQPQPFWTPSQTPTWIASPTPLPTAAPEDVTPHVLTLIPGVTSYFSEMISYPGGDTEDQILIQQPENVSYEFDIAMSCIGDNTAALRWYWGTGVDQQFTCGETTSSLMQMAEQTLYVIMPEGSSPGLVIYSLVITARGNVPTPTPPAAAPPDTEPHVRVVEPGVRVQFMESVSSAPGDALDTIRIQVDGTVSSDLRYNIRFDCGTYATDLLIWTIGDDTVTGYSCWAATQAILFTPAQSEAVFRVSIPDRGVSTYVAYSLILEPITETSSTPPPAPWDAEPKDFPVTKGFSSYSDQVSAPDGDMIDRIHMTVTDMQPGEWRDLVITMTCSGENTETMIWVTLVGQKTNGCGATLYAGVSEENNQISFDVTFPEGQTDYASVSYTLEVR